MGLGLFSVGLFALSLGLEGTNFHLHTHSTHLEATVFAAVASFGLRMTAKLFETVQVRWLDTFAWNWLPPILWPRGSKAWNCESSRPER